MSNLSTKFHNSSVIQPTDKQTDRVTCM